MRPPTKDEEVRAVVGELDALLAQLRESVAALTAVLEAPPPESQGQEVPVP